MKQIITGVAIGVTALSVFAQWGNTGAPAGQVYSTSLTASSAATAYANFFLLLTNRADIYSVQLASTAAGQPATVTFYDTGNTNNVTNIAGLYGISNVVVAYNGVASYPTNVVTSFIGYNGVTNNYTNSGIFTYSVTNSMTTNLISPAATLVASTGIFSTYQIDLLMEKGVVVSISTNATLIFYYRNAK